MKMRLPWIRTAAAVLLAGAAFAATASTAAAQSREPAKPDAAKAEQTQAKYDVIIFRDGKRQECEIIEETDSTVKVKVSIAGMVAETVYQKSEILAIQKGAGAVIGGSGKTDNKPAPGKKPDTKQPEPLATDGIPSVYVIRCTGEFGRDVSATPFAQVIDDVKKFQPDILIMEFDHTYALYDEEAEREYFWIDPDQFNVLETARQIATILTDRIRDDAEWTKKPRLVGYIKKALGGAAFLPFACSELYFHPDAYHGGIGGLDIKYGNTGDEVVREKLRGAQLKRAEGLAEKGGWDPRILRAMARIDFVLSYRFVGGRGEFVERMPESADEFLLTDDGQGENRDNMQDIVRYMGNDALTLSARSAERIGFSKGTVSSIDELMREMGFNREFNLVKGRSESILKAWSGEIDRAEANILRLIRQFQGVQIRPPGEYKERTAARTQQKNALREARAIVNRYREAINPQRFPPDAAISQIDILIDQIEQAQRLDGPP